MSYDPRAAATEFVSDLPLFGREEPAHRANASVEERYAAWRATTEGQHLFDQIARVCLQEAGSGATRVSVYRAFEVLRGRPPHPSIDNRFRALVSRDLAAKYAILDRLLERRTKGEG